MPTNNPERGSLFGPTSQTAYGLDWQRKANPSAVAAPVDDAQGHTRDASKNLGSVPCIFRGRVVDTIAYANCYRVLLERNGGVILCMAMVPGGLLPVGANVLSSFGPGSEVYVLQPMAPPMG